MCRIWFLNMWIGFKQPKRHRSAHDVSRKVRPHKSYHAYVLWHLQYLSTAVLCSTCPPQRRSSKTLRHSISTLTHALKHLAAAESNATKTPGDPKRVNQKCTEVVLRGGEANPRYGFGTGSQIRGGEIPATDSELGNADTTLIYVRTLTRKRCSGNN